ncbi:hypothetical protein G7B40_021635 [Aetokthonos hydrillicola Thurmond2011]|jgi:hypothetical protein|uniref:Uncharacterized protein n=1 Tax=Aetokthonos hydrillicola Thurmond2011 TaxID=2712845 RepID=A0AAP5I963_9CYAN|nr:hypothetical protein [Aetokthonos hydrillicola]MBO3457771.1 hypothetical protein [Aetokthonos hydrillicola CCALA 1050]MBW4589378.1 hypothetical protein [Aetokthonos hydrillicola CCALA 1050]MDR9897145.1 hypothetical protein [Aetokthonos hydrillicola Thurmond2011]
MGLSEGLSNPTKKAMVVDDCCKMIDAQLASKQGISGIALKTAFNTLKGIKPGYISDVVETLLPQCLDAIDPIWCEGVQNGDPVEYLVEHRSRTAEVLLSVTDNLVKDSKRKIARATYNQLRGSAKQHVEAAVPDLAKVIEKYTKTETYV